MSKRFPPPSTAASALDSTLDAEVERHHGKNPSFQYKDSAGAPIGPFAILAYTPDLFQPFMACGGALLHQAHVSPRMRELVILAVTAAHSTPYVAYAHTLIARGLEPGLSAEQAAAACQGRTPEGLSGDEEVAFETALAMARGVGALGDAEWRRSEQALGKEVMARIGGLVGFYLYACTLVRMGQVAVPGHGEPGS